MRGHNSDGFMTIVQPAAKAGETFHALDIFMTMYWSIREKITYHI